MSGAGREPTVRYQHASCGAEEMLRPTLVVSGGRSYRKLTDVEFGQRPGGRKTRTRVQQTQPSDGPVQEARETEAVCVDDVYDEGEDIDAELAGVEKLSNGNYRLKLQVPSVFFKYVIGREGRVKKGIERDTECHLWVPGRGKEGDIGENNSEKALL